MDECVFYAAISADGYLAGPDGDMSWAAKYLADGEDYGYFGLVSSSSAVLMGRATFDFEIESGVSGPRPLPTYVVTHIPELYADITDENLNFVGGDMLDVFNLIQARHPGRLFVMGGADVVRQLLDDELIDTMRLFICPDILDSGIKAFDDEPYGEFVLVSERPFKSGLTEKVYNRINK
jgi:dihydrofolate reductase